MTGIYKGKAGFLFPKAWFLVYKDNEQKENEDMSDKEHLSNKIIFETLQYFDLIEICHVTINFYCLRRRDKRRLVKIIQIKDCEFKS